MEVKLVSMTQIDENYLHKLMKEGKNERDIDFVKNIQSPEGLMAYCARVSSPDQKNPKYEKLLSYCAKHGHWSVFEMADATFEITTSRAIAQQIIRHRSFCFQEFCMAGDTQVYFDLPGALKKGKRRIYKLTLEELYKKWNGKDALGNSLRERVKGMNVRIYDNNSKLMTHSHIKEVFQTGVKDIFEITLENGKVIRSTKEHKVLTENGFNSLENAFGLQLIGNTAVIEKNGFIGCNGIPVYRDYNWMKEAKKNSLISGGGVDEIAKQAGVSYHTIRKWLKKLNLTFTKVEMAKITTLRGGVWNKGKSGYSWGTHSKETRKLLSKKARKGKDSNFWKGGVTKERDKIQADIKKYRIDLIVDYKGNCGLCSKPLNGKCDLHHIVPVSEDVTLAREYSNLMPVHLDCHKKHHGIQGDLKKWKEKSKGNKLTVRWSKIKSVKYLGKQMTYDLEIDHPSHNYVANGVIVHNSQRYAKVSDGIEVYQARSQDNKNRQNSIDDMSKEDKEWFINAQHQVKDISLDLYNEALAKGVAKEQARFLLPLNTKTRLFMKGSIRSWIHYINIRAGNGTQKEHEDIALQIKDILTTKFPSIAKAMKWS
jgi:thymidylate synthase (FAD)